MAVVFVIVGFIFAMNFQKESKAAFLDQNKPMNIQMPDVDKIMKKIKVDEVMVQNIQGKKELVTMETDLKQEVQWDNSIYEWDILKKYQNMVFYSKAKFSTDLAEITKDMIIYNPDSNILTVKAKKPVVSSLEILNDKTEIYSTTNGLLRFGEIKLTAAEQNELIKKVKNSMYLELHEEQMLKLANENTIKSLRELVGTFLESAGINDVNINVVLI